MTASEHEAIRLRLPELAEGELLRDERARIESHLAGCKSCQDELFALVQTLGLLRALPHPKAPPDLAAKVRTRIRRRGSMSRSREVVEHKIETTSAAAVMVATLIVIGTRLAVPTPEHMESASGVTPASATTAEPTSLFEIRAVDADDARGILARAASAGAVSVDGGPIIPPQADKALDPGLRELWVARKSLRSVLTESQPPPLPPPAMADEAPGSDGAEGRADVKTDPEHRVLLRMWVR